MVLFSWHTFKQIIMKKAIKLPLLLLAVSLSVAACKGNQSGNSTDSAKVDSSSSMKSTADTTVKVDSVKATDTSAAKVDTVSKTVTKNTAVKKTKTTKQ